MSNTPIICLDAGHGGNDPGAVANNMQEAAIAFEVVTHLAEMLRRRGFNIILSRPDPRVNPGINARWQFANQQNADYFISIHVNAGRGTGAETFYFRESGERSRRSENFAHYINNYYAQRMELRNRGVKSDTQTAIGALGVLRHTRMPAILLELAFIDNPAINPDIPILRDARKDAAQRICDAMLDYFEIEQAREDDPPQSVAPRTLTVDVLGRDVEIGGFIDDGVTFVALADIARAMGYVPTWDRERHKPVVSTPQHIEARFVLNYAIGVGLDGADGDDLLTCCDELRLLKTIVHWEAGGEDIIGQTMVANVVKNRIADPRFPDTITEVILAPGAFTPTEREDFRTAQPGTTTVEAVQKALGGAALAQGATFFHQLSSLTPDVWHERAVADGRLVRLFDYGNHRFYKHA